MTPESYSNVKKLICERSAELATFVDQADTRIAALLPTARSGSEAGQLELIALRRDRDEARDAIATLDLFLGLPERTQLKVAAVVRRQYVDRALSLTYEGRAVLADRARFQGGHQ